MKIAVLDDGQDAAKGLNRFALLAGRDVTVFNETLGADHWPHELQTLMHVCSLAIGPPLPRAC